MSHMWHTWAVYIGASTWVFRDATRCNTLQHAATRCNTLQYTVTYAHRLECLAQTVVKRHPHTQKRRVYAQMRPTHTKEMCEHAEKTKTHQRDQHTQRRRVWSHNRQTHTKVYTHKRQTHTKETNTLKGDVWLSLMCVDTSSLSFFSSTRCRSLVVYKHKR